MTPVPPGTERAGGGQGRAPRRTGRLAVLAIILFALAFAVGGFLAVKAITAGRVPADGRPAGAGPPAAPDSQKETPPRD